jgi:uncharacterized RDD family membrane protein YckC
VLSPWWRRAIAIVVDGAIISTGGRGLAVVFGTSLDEQFHRGGSPLLPTAAPLLVVVFTFLITALYLPPMMAATDGRTLGKLLLRIRVVRADARRMTVGRAALREVVVKNLLIAHLPLLYFVLIPMDALWPLWDRENRAIHDFLAGTRVVEVV